jgi:NitT/TauT family transport system ATP-binding protein
VGAREEFGGEAIPRQAAFAMTQKIQIRELSKVFPKADGGSLQVVDHLSFAVAEKEFVSLLGPSGCGKSTLLNILAGLEAATGGEVLVDGVGVGRGRPAFGLVFQEPRLLNWRTVRQNLLFPLEHIGLPRDEAEARLSRYLKLVGLEKFEEYYPLQLSGGMQMRVAIARALAIEPAVLLMDEPFSSLDAINARKMREELIRIWQEAGRTVLFVTHDVGEAVFLSTRVLIVTPRPARLYAEVPVDVPYPRHPEDDRLFSIEKQVVKTFFQMEAQHGGAA